MASKRHERTTARRVALQVLYTAEIKGASAAQIVAEGVFPSEEGPLSEYAQDLVRGVEQNRIVIDGSLKAAAENWSLGRMPIVDRSILRLAAYEIMFVEDVPTSAYTMGIDVIMRARRLLLLANGQGKAHSGKAALPPSPRTSTMGPLRLPQAMTRRSPWCCKGAIRWHWNRTGPSRSSKAAWMRSSKR